MKVFCVYGKASTESKIATLVQKIYTDVDALVPVRVMREKRRGVWRERQRPLLPGYLFVYVPGRLGFDLVRSLLDVYGFAQYEAGVRQLQGVDYAYSMWVHRHSGVIGLSRVEIGERVRVLEGPLLDSVGEVVRLDRHRKRAWLEFDFDGKKRVVALSVEITAAEQ